jgi:hypothetical protein
MARDQRTRPHRDVVAGAAALQHRVQVAGRDQHPPAQNRVAVLGLLHFHLAQAVQPACEGLGELLRHMLDDHDARRVAGHHLQHLAQRFRAAGGGAHADDRFRGARHCTRHRWRQHGIGGEFGGRGRRRSTIALQWPHAPQPRVRGAFHHFANMRTVFDKLGGDADAGFENDVDGACRQRLHEGLRTRFDERGAHYDRNGMLSHQLAQESDAIHARHLDIQRDDIGHVVCDAGGSYERIGGNAQHLDLGVRGQYLREGLPDRSRVIDDENADTLAGQWHDLCLLINRVDDLSELQSRRRPCFRMAENQVAPRCEMG